MARIFMTGFESGALGAVVATGASFTVSAAQKRTGGYSAYCSSYDNCGTISLPTGYQELFFRTGFYSTGAGNTTGVFLSFGDATVTHLIVVYDWKTSVVLLYRGTTLIATSTLTAPVLAWNCIEGHAKIDNSVGVFTLKVNGVTFIDFSGDTQNAGTATITRMILGSPPDSPLSNSAAYGYFDDIAINDTTGSVNNSWIGQGGVYLCPINGAGTVTGMTPSAGSNYACVDEVPANDTDYVSSADVADIDLYTIDTSALPTPIRVDAVKLGYRAKVDAGGANLVPVLRSESTTEEQTDDALAMSTSYTVQSVDYDVDPIDDAAWDAAKLAALEVGQRKGL